MIDAVLLDVDGTLIDSNRLHVAAWLRAFDHFGVQASEEAVAAQLGKGGDQLMPVFMSPEQVDRLGPELEALRARLYRDEYLPHAKAFAGVRALFERLRREGCRTVLASSGKTTELEHYQRIAGITDLVDAVVTSEDVAHSKPAPDIFQAALERIAPIRAKDAIAVGDTPYDAQSAASAGVRTIGVLSGGFGRGELVEAGCVAIYDDIADLVAGFDRSPLADG